MRCTKTSKSGCIRAITGVCFLAPAVVVTVLMAGIPLVKTAVYSVSAGLEGSAYVGWTNYRQLFSGESFRLGLANTVRFYAVALPLMVFLPLVLAAVVNRATSFRKTLSRLFFLPAMIPTASLFWFIRLALGNDGVVNGWLSSLGLEPVSFFSDPWAFCLLILLYLYRYGGYNFFLYLIALSAVPESHYEEAALLGASDVQIFWLILFPQITPTIELCAVFSLMNGYHIYREAYLIGGAYPAESLYMLQHFLYNNFQNLQYNKLCAAAMWMLAVVVSAMALAALMIGILRQYRMRQRRKYGKT